MFCDVVDLHTHTLASGHAYNTIYEMVHSASSKGVQLLGISEHGPAMEGSACKHYFRASRRIPRELNNVKLLFGVEYNIIDFHGNVDLDETFSAPLDYAIASMHVECIQPGSVAENTSAYLGAMYNPKVFILGHPDDGTFEVDFELLARAAAQNHILIELNEASVRPGSYRENARQNAYRMLSACKRNGTHIVVSSDAHVETEVLNHHYALQMLEDIQFPEELIVNTSVQKVMDLLDARRSYVNGAK